MRATALFLLVASVLAGAALASGTQTPKLRLADAMPLTVTGTGFRSHERVKVVYTAERAWTKSVVATAGGAFTTRFADVIFQACKFHRLTATGSLGSRALFRMPPVPCQPPTGAP